MELHFSVELLSCLRLVFCSVDSSSAFRHAWTFFSDGSKTGSLAVWRVHGMHHAMMLAVPAAAGWEARLGIRGEQGRCQQPAEDEYQRKCNRAPHARY